jgi:hypothetical protein
MFLVIQKLVRKKEKDIKRGQLLFTHMAPEAPPKFTLPNKPP